MQKIILHPLKGIQLEKGISITFGMDEDEVINAIGSPSDKYENKLFFDHLELRIDLDDANKVEFIEFIYGPYPEHTEIEVYGINPFSTPANELVSLLSGQNDGFVDDSEKPFCYCFHAISVGVFRDACEERVQEYINEVKQNGEYEGREGEMQEEMEKSRYFWTIGIGKAGYYG
jgi:hypothetical protein